MRPQPDARAGRRWRFADLVTAVIVAGAGLLLLVSLLWHWWQA